MQTEFPERYITLGLKIAYYRKKAGLTQEVLAERIGKSVNFVGQVEGTGTIRGVSLETLFKDRPSAENPALQAVGGRLNKKRKRTGETQPPKHIRWRCLIAAKEKIQKIHEAQNSLVLCMFAAYRQKVMVITSCNFP